LVTLGRTFGVEGGLPAFADSTKHTLIRFGKIPADVVGIRAVKGSIDEEWGCTRGNFQGAFGAFERATSAAGE
jgi:hypothetical protein